MKIAVFDTYVVRPDGRRMHFDILVSDESKGMDLVLSYGQCYLDAKGVKVENFSSRECRFCHTESASAPVENEIKRSGFAIIELENCD